MGCATRDDERSASRCVQDLRSRTLGRLGHPGLEACSWNVPTGLDQSGSNRGGADPSRIESQGHAPRIDVHLEVEDPGHVLQNPIHLDRTPDVSVQALNLVLDADPAIRPRFRSGRRHDEPEQGDQHDARGDADPRLDPFRRGTAYRGMAYRGVARRGTAPGPECRPVGGIVLGSGLHGRPYEAGGALGRANPRSSVSAMVRRSSTTRSSTASRPASLLRKSSPCARGAARSHSRTGRQRSSAWPVGGGAVHGQWISALRLNSQCSGP